MASATPLVSDGSLNLAAVQPQVESLLAWGISGIVAVGGTGEASALTPDERARFVGATVLAAKGRVPVLANAGPVRVASRAPSPELVETMRSQFQEVLAYEMALRSAGVRSR